MLLSLRVLNNYTNPNFFSYGTQFRFTQGDTLLLYFQLIDVSKDTQANPPGLRYIPQLGLTNRAMINGLNGDSFSLTASTNQITISFAPPSAAGLWNSVPQPGDLLVIPSTSVFAGAANANVGNYTILSASNTTVTAVKTPFTTLPVSIANPVILSATPANDLIDYGYGAILQVQVSSINQANIVSRWAYQPAPQLDPSIWALQVYPSDPLQGTADVYLSLTEGTTTTSGIARGVMQINTNPNNTNMVQVSPSAGNGAITTF